MQLLHPESRVRVRFKDCDPLGHLYNTRFLEYMLEAREDHVIDHYDLNLEEYASQKGLAWVVVGHQISYFKEAKRNEFVRIRSAMIYYDQKTVLNEYQMWDDGLKEIKSLMWTRFLHIDLHHKKVSPHGEEMMHKLSEINMKIDQLDFEERAKYLRLFPLSK